MLPAETEPNEGMFRSVVESAPNGIVMVDARGRIVMFNSQAEKLFGYQRADVIGQSIEILLPSSIRGAHVRHREGFNREQQARPMGVGRDLYGLRKDGSQVPVEIGLNPIETPEGRFVLAAIVDITERKNAEKERIRLEKQVLEAAEREQRRIGQDLHDSLGQKLLGIGFLAKVLKEELDTAAPAHVDDAERIVHLLNEALAHTRHLARGLYAAELEASDLPTALMQLTLNIQSMVGVTCRFVDTAPSIVYDRNVATNLYRIAQEAINNAVRHGKARAITVTLSETDRIRTLSIADDGIGMPPQPSRPGGGMGLHVMRYRANVIGARIDMRSRVGGGTTVECTLPVDAAKRDLAEPRP